jgi:hypothetical protein
MRQAREQAAREPAPKQQPRQQQRQLTVEQWIDQHPRKTAEWMHANKEFVTDRDKHEALLEFGREWAADYGQHTLHSPQFIEAMEEVRVEGDGCERRADTTTKEEPEQKPHRLAAERAAAPGPALGARQGSGDNKDQAHTAGARHRPWT